MCNNVRSQEQLPGLGGGGSEGWMFASRLVASSLVLSYLDISQSFISVQFQACCVFLERGETLYWGPVNIKVDS